MIAQDLFSHLPQRALEDVVLLLCHVLAKLGCSW